MSDDHRIILDGLFPSGQKLPPAREGRDEVRAALEALLRIVDRDGARLTLALAQLDKGAAEIARLRAELAAERAARIAVASPVRREGGAMKIEKGIGWVSDEKTPGNLRSAYDRDYVAEIERLHAELAATRDRAICYRTEYPYCDADLDMHGEATIAAERERCAKIVENWWKRHWHTTPAPCEATSNEIAAAIRKGEP